MAAKFTILAPHTALGNNPRSMEYNVEWVRDIIRYMVLFDTWASAI